MPSSAFTDEYATLIRILIAARKSAGVTQAELAERLGKPQPFISKVERGVRRIDVIEFYAIARALSIEPVALFKKLASALPRSFDI